MAFNKDSTLLVFGYEAQADGTTEMLGRDLETNKLTVTLMTPHT